MTPVSPSKKSPYCPTRDFGQRLYQVVSEYGNVCVGIDPHPHLLRAWNLEETPDGLLSFCLSLIDKLTGIAGIVKPQSAFFECYGSRGIAVLERVIRECHARDIQCIIDVKRGDIGSTMDGYAHAYCSPSSTLYSDALTVSPYLGPESVSPLAQLASENHCGVFFLCLTSNPQGAIVQHALSSDGVSVAGHVARYVHELNTRYEPHLHKGFASYGMVIGATIGSSTLREQQVDITSSKAPFLVPGIGAQGASVDDVAHIFGSAMSRVLACASRSIVNQGLKKVPEAIETLREDMARACTA